MIKVSSKMTGLEKIGPAIENAIRRPLPLEVRTQILAEEGAPVAELMTAKAPRGSHNPHAADFIRATPMPPGPGNEARVAIGVVDVPGKKDRGFVFQFIEYGTKHMGARPFLRPTADSELSAMLERVRARVAQALGA